MSDLPPSYDFADARIILDPEAFVAETAEHNQWLDDQALIENAGASPIDFPLGLTDLERDTLRRKAAAVKDAAMLGDSGYERIEADAYFTPPENVDCLSQFVDLPKGIWEPACGSGNISQRLKEFGHEVVSSDLHSYGFEEQIGTFDFLATDVAPDGVRAIVTNPPYGDLVEKFIRHGIKLMKPKAGLVALFLRNEYDCGKNRMDLFGQFPFSKKIVVTKRPRWIEGSSGSPRHNYAWFVWDFRQQGPATIHFQHPDFATPRILKD